MDRVAQPDSANTVIMIREKKSVCWYWLTVNSNGKDKI